MTRIKERPNDITKHEIVAKFVMDTRTIRSKSRMDYCISAFSKSVTDICPELISPMERLMFHLKVSSKINRIFNVGCLSEYSAWPKISLYGQPNSEIFLKMVGS